MTSDYKTKPQEGVDHELAVGDDQLAFVVRTSERKNFKKCRRYWHFNSPMRMAREPIRMNHNLEFGIAVHNGLEAYYSNWHLEPEMRKAMMLDAFIITNGAQYDSINNPSQEDDEEYDERQELGKGMLSYYHTWAQDNETLTPVHVEELILVPIPDRNGNPVTVGWNGLILPVLYQVRIDVLAKDENGELWVLDHKTATSEYDITHLGTDTQISSYVWAAILYYGEPIAGFIYSELFKRYPSPPRILKSGKISKDKRQYTTFDMYLKTIEQRELNRADYSDFLSFLKQREEEGGNRYIRRTKEYRNQDELEVTEDMLRRESLDMICVDDNVYPNPHKFNCNTCPFYMPCRAMGEQGDWQFYLDDNSIYRERGSFDNELADKLQDY